MSEAVRIPLRRKMPAHLRERLDRWFLLVRWANGVRHVYGVPVYLVGSALRDDNAEPRDWDVRVRLPARAFERRFGPVGLWVDEGRSGLWTAGRWRWSEECVKRTKVGWEQTRLNIDFQIEPPPEWRRYRGKPRLRLDTRDRFLIGKGETLMTPDTDPAVRAIAETCHVSLEVAEQAWRAAREAVSVAAEGAVATPCAACGHALARHTASAQGACLDCECPAFTAPPAAGGAEAPAEPVRLVTAGDGGAGADRPH